MNPQRLSIMLSSILFMIIPVACNLPTAIAATSEAVTNPTQSVSTAAAPTQPVSPAAAPTQPVSTAISATPKVNTPDWSGYVAKGDTFTSVEATWQQPTVTCPVSNARVAFWVGLDDGPTIEQAGTSGVCNGLTASYHAWWMMFVKGNTKTQSLFPVSPGDTISSSVHYINGMYALQVTDKTSGQTSSSLQPCNAVCARSTAEWIVEAPAVKSGGLYPLANYSTVKFTEPKAGTGSKTGGISAFNDVKYIMVQKGTLLSAPGDLAAGSKGTMFTVTWHAVQ